MKGSGIHLVLGYSVDAGSDSLDVHLVAKVIGYGLTPFLELIRSELELVIAMTKDAVGALRGVWKAWASAKILAKVVVEAIVGRCD